MTYEATTPSPNHIPGVIFNWRNTFVQQHSTPWWITNYDESAAILEYLASAFSVAPPSRSYGATSCHGVSEFNHFSEGKLVWRDSSWLAARSFQKSFDDNRR